MNVSVIIPCHNAGPYLAQAIGSALDQRRPPHEVIVVDDGSTDGSLALARQFADRLPQQIHVRAERSGRASRTRNLGALVATGDAFLFLDADDVLGPDALEAMVVALARTGGVALCPWFRMEYSGDRWIRQPPSCSPRLPGQDALSAWLTGWYHPPCAILWSRDAFERAGRWDELATVNDDGDLMMRALACGVPLASSTRGAAYYRRRADGATSLSGTRFTRGAITSRLRVVRKLAWLLELDGRLDGYRAPVRQAFQTIADDAAGHHEDLHEEARRLARAYAPRSRIRAHRRVTSLTRVPGRLASRALRAVAHLRPGRAAVRLDTAPQEVRDGVARAEQLLRRPPSVAPPTPSPGAPAVERPAVSIIIPTYNRARLLARALESVRSQTVGDLEVLVVDDASGDDTGAVVASCRDSRVRYLRQPHNGGVGAARNRGLREARADFIAFLDSDDEWLPDKLERQLEVFRGRPESVGLVFTGVETVRESGEHAIACSRERANVYREMLWRNVIHGGGSNVMIRRAVVATAGFFREDLSAIEDYDYWLRIARFFEVDFVDAPLIRYYDPPRADRRSVAATANLEARWWFYRTYAAEMRRAGVAHLFLVNTARWILLSSDPDVRPARRLAVQALLEKPISRLAFAMLLRTTLPGAGRIPWVQRHAMLG